MGAHTTYPSKVFDLLKTLRGMSLDLCEVADEMGVGIEPARCWVTEGVAQGILVCTEGARPRYALSRDWGGHA